MWTTVLALALSVMFEPVRLGLVVLMLHRRRPLLQLLVFLCGGYTMGIGVGLVLLFVLGAAPLAGHLSVPAVQVVTGLIALLVAGVLAAGFSTSTTRRAPATVGGAGGVAVPEPPPGRVAQWSAHARRLLRGDSLRVAAVGGLAAALPSANYLGAMAAILASGAAPVAQAQALLTFNVTAFAVAEIPLVSYLAAPRQTLAVLATLLGWLRSRTRRDVATVVAAGGCLMLVLGCGGLR